MYVISLFSHFFRFVAFCASMGNCCSPANSLKLSLMFLIINSYLLSYEGIPVYHTVIYNDLKKNVINLTTSECDVNFSLSFPFYQWLQT